LAELKDRYEEYHKLLQENDKTERTIVALKNQYNQLVDPAPPPPVKQNEYGIAQNTTNRRM
jgi:hypothetical protein